MRYEIYFRAIGNINVFRFCTPQIFIVEIAVLQNFSCLNMYFCSFWHVDMEFKDSREFLSHIENQLTCRSMNQFFWPESFMNRHRKTHAIGQFPFRCITEDCLLCRKIRQRIIPMLAVVEIGKRNFAASYLPCLICTDDFFRAVCIHKMQLRNQLPVISVKASILKRTETKPRLIPAVAKQYTECSLARKLLCHIVCLILYPLIIIIAVRCQIFISDTLLINKHFIQSKSAYIQPCFCHFFCRNNFLFKIRMAFFFTAAGDPFGRPCFLPLSSFKKLHFAYCFFSGIAACFHRPVIPCSRLQLQFHRIAKATRFRILPRVKQQMFHRLIR